MQSRRYDLVSIWRNSSLRKLYRKRLRKYTVVQTFAEYFGQNIFPIFYNKYIKLIILRLLNAKETRWRTIIKLCEFVEQKNLKTYKLEDEIVIEPPKPIVFPCSDQNYFISSSNHTKFPEVYVAILKNGTIYGDTNFVFVEEGVICHDLYDFKKDYTSDELHCRAVINPNRNYIRWLVHDEKPDRISVAAAFVDACAHNYAHWLSEVLPRVVSFCSDHRFKDVPIVVNDGLHKNIMESLLIAAGSDREILLLPGRKALCCDKLYVISTTGYVPFDWRERKIPNPSHGIFNTNAFNKLRSHYIGTTYISKNRVLADKIFISRNSGTRRCTNNDEIEKQLLKHGYMTVYPEKLSFLEQVEMFKNAKKIVATTGAGLANAIFCTPGVSLGILMARHERMIYRYWMNMLAFSHYRIFYILGDITEKKALGIHGDFSVNQNDFMHFLEAIEGNHV